MSFSVFRSCGNKYECNLSSCFLFLSVCLLSCDLCRHKPLGRKTNLKRLPAVITPICHCSLSSKVCPQTFSITTLYTIYCLVWGKPSQKHQMFLLKTETGYQTWQFSIKGKQPCLFYVHYLLPFSLSDWWTENSPFHFCSHSTGTFILDTPPHPSVDLPLLLVLPSLFTALLFDRNYMTPLPWQQRCVSENEHRGEATDSPLAFNLRFVSKNHTQILQDVAVFVVLLLFSKMSTCGLHEVAIATSRIV